MQRLPHSFPSIVFLLLFLASGSQFFAQHNIPNLREYSPEPRVFYPMGCRDVGHSGAPIERFYQDNYDMSESIARSDTFDIDAYEIDLDLSGPATTDPELAGALQLLAAPKPTGFDMVIKGSF